MRRKLMPHQAEAVNQLINTKRAVLNHDTGLGKTFTCIETANRVLGLESRESLRVLVVCPAFLISNWESEVKAYSDKAVEYTVVSYHACLKPEKVAELEGVNFRIVICDEAHYLKNWSAKWTKAILLKLCKGRERIIFATATSYVKNALDLHPIYSVCSPGAWGTVKAFGEEYCNKVYNRFRKWNKWEYRGYKPETAEKLRQRAKGFVFKKSKDDAGLNLPDKLIQDIYLKVPSNCHLSAAKHVDLAKMLRDLDKGNITEEIHSSAQEVGLSKVTAAIQWVECLGDQQAVVFVWHRAVAAKLMEGMKDENAALFVGGMDRKVQDRVLEDFRSGKTRILVASIAALGLGVNLQHCNVALFVELAWSAVAQKQAEDRFHRIGQERKVHIYRMIGRSTIDEVILKAQSYKKEGSLETTGVEI